MTMQVRRVRIYVGAAEQAGSQPLFNAVSERLQREGATAVVVLQGVAGFGTWSSNPGGMGWQQRELPPVVIEWIDTSERITRLLPQLDDLLSNAVITFEDIHAYRAALRSHGPFEAGRFAGDLAWRDIRVIKPNAPLAAALGVLIESEQEVVPVVEANGQLVGLVSERELIDRAQLSLPIAFLRLLDGPTIKETLQHAPLDQPISTFMNREPRSASADTSLSSAFVMMMEWNYRQLPLVDTKGTLVGLLRDRDLLRTAASQPNSDQGHVRMLTGLPDVGLFMQAHFAAVPAERPLNASLALLLATPHHIIAVTDNEGAYVGILTDRGVLKRLQPEIRKLVILAAQRGQWASLQNEESLNQPLRTWMETNQPVLAPSDSFAQAATLILAHPTERLLVLDSDRHPAGIVAVGGMLRTLLQTIT